MVIDLPSRQGQSIVSMVTDLLNDATQDKIAILGIAYVHKDGDVVYRVSAGEGFYKLLGALDGMKFDMLKDKQGD